MEAARPLGDASFSSPPSDEEGAQGDKYSLHRSLAISARASACSSCGGSIFVGVGCPRGLEASMYLDFEHGGQTIGDERGETIRWPGEI